MKSTKVYPHFWQAYWRQALLNILDVCDILFLYN